MDVFKEIEKHGLELHGDIEYFAELVRADEREVCVRLIQEGTDEPMHIDALRIVRAERERLVNKLREHMAEIQRLRQALAQPKQRGHCTCGDPEALGVVHFRTRPCFHYIHQPKREWVGLTDEEIDKTMVEYPIDYKHEFAKAIEAKLKEKNT